MQLTTHFSLEEMVKSSTALRLGIDNTPSEEVQANLQVTAEGLEAVRRVLKLYNDPVLIDSGYRCPALNAAVHGSKTSAHMSGWAADFICPGYGTPLQIVKTIEASDLQFDQVIQEGTWVHISFDPRMRREVLTATFNSDGVVYSQGA